MPKKIALFCDGTWNSAEQRYPTNVCLLSESTAHIAGAQHVHYFDGVGIHSDRLWGGLFGIGLDRILLDAYKALCADYDPGDELFLFGFSRGAYTARSLVGMMRKCGVLKKEHLAKADEALSIYRCRETDGPDSETAIAFRHDYAAACYAAPGSPHAACAPQLTVHYMGIWETIGALGVPERIPFARFFNRRYHFHDCDISSMVERAQHALAIDEVRHALTHTPWTEESVRRINDAHGERRIEQVWFPGDHGSVGGGGMRAQLSSGALLWVADGARRAGLVIDDAKDHLNLATTTFDAVNGLLKNADGDPIGLSIQGRGPRLNQAPQTMDELSTSAKVRAAGRWAYLRDASQHGRWRRQTLAPLLEALAG
jgi:uncharacterized protein (DUF2235 family)